MNTTKAHIAALSLLDRALIAIPDDELKALLAGLPADHVSAVRRISGLRPNEATHADDDADADAGIGEPDAGVGADSRTGADSGTDADSEAAADDVASADTAPTTPDDIDDELVDAIRVAAHKGRLNGDLQRLGVVLSDACLAECVSKLGDKADMPSEDDLTGVLPDLVEHHGVGAVRLMLASTVVGEAPASATIVSLLKNNDLVKLPVTEPKPLAPLLPPKEDDAERLRLKALRKERKAQEQAAAKLRREQIARAKNRV